jgi:hypothetical protein
MQAEDQTYLIGIFKDYMEVMHRGLVQKFGTPEYMWKELREEPESIWASLSPVTVSKLQEIKDHWIDYYCQAASKQLTDAPRQVLEESAQKVWSRTFEDSLL